MKIINSPYSAAITGCPFMFNEFVRILPLLGSDDLIKDEVENNRILQVNSRKARRTFMSEFKRRYDAVPSEFWLFFKDLSEAGQKLALLYAILKTYKLVFDFHFDVTLKRWRSVDAVVDKGSIMSEFDDLSNKDEFVASWSDNTKEKCASQYLTVLRQAGLAEKDGTLKQPDITASDFKYYIANGEEWFLEACLLYPYQIDNIKSELQ